MDASQLYVRSVADSADDTLPVAKTLFRAVANIGQPSPTDIKRYQAIVSSALGLLGKSAHLSHADKEDLRQAGLLAILEAIKKHGNTKGRAWLFQAVWRDIQRAHAVMHPEYCITLDEALPSDGSELTDSTENFIDPSPTPDVQAEAASEVSQLLSKLSAEDRKLVAMHHGLDGYESSTVRQLARLYKTTRMDIQRKLEQLHAVMRDVGTNP